MISLQVSDIKKLEKSSLSIYRDVHALGYHWCLTNFANYRPSASNFKSFFRSLEQLFLTIGQNNFGNKIPFLLCKLIFGAPTVKKKCILIFPNLLFHLKYRSPKYAVLQQQTDGHVRNLRALIGREKIKAHTANIFPTKITCNPEIYLYSAPNNSNETYTLMCMGREGRFGHC